MRDLRRKTASELYTKHVEKLQVTKAYSRLACSRERPTASEASATYPLAGKPPPTNPGSLTTSPAASMAEPKARAQARTTTPTLTWSQRAEALTHILTHPSHSPSLHSQLFLASRVPCPPPGSSYPPFLCPGAALLRWAITAVFLPRAARLGLPPSSWRSRCPFQLPPPLVPSVAIEPAPERWGEAELVGYARRRRSRRGPMRARPPVSVAGVVLTTVTSLAIIAVIVRELFWVLPNRI